MNLSPWMATGLMFGMLASMPAPAVIVAGANGNGLGNATESGLQSYLGSQSLATFPYWNNLLRVSDSSGIYLGHNPATGQGWVMTATHVTPLSNNIDTITVAGQVYPVRATQVIQHTDGSGTYNTDIRLYRIGGETGDPALPSLPTVTLLDSNVTLGDDLLMTGRSRRQQVPSEDTTVPYAWDMDTTSAGQLTREMRWGSNQVEIWSAAAPYTLFYLEEGGKRTISFASAFDNPAAGGTAAEGQLALLDSGGGAFVERGGVWYLAGTNYTVADGPDADTPTNPTAGYGDVSIMTHLPSYRTQIIGITGPLVPESGTWLLAAGGTMLLMRRSRRG